MFKIHGQGHKTALKEWLVTGGATVITYEATGYFTLENDFRFTLLVADEAHYIKNPEARRTINAKKLSDHADRLLFMTGTALTYRFLSYAEMACECILKHCRVLL